MLRRIRQWCHDTEDPLCRGVVRGIKEASDLRAGLASVDKEPDTSVLIALGWKVAEIYDCIPAERGDRLEIIVHSRGPDKGSEQFPSASLLGRQKPATAKDVVAALRKSLIRLRAGQYSVVRTLQSKEDFRAYFSLRYSVWKQLDYLPAQKDCADSRWELDYTDRTAHPIGAFSKEGPLVGCARLVRGLGEESSIDVEIITNLIEERNDPKLRANFSYPRTLTHPFDVLESFPGFRDYYRSLVRSRTPTAEVSRVIVQDEYRKHGLGEVLVDSIASLARQKGIQILFLACRKEHQSFYERSGFRKIEDMSCDQFVNVNVPAIAMERRLRMV